MKAAQDLVLTQPTDPGLVAALHAQGLVTADLGQGEQYFWRLTRDGETAGFVGLERHGEAAVLRSLVVLGDHRGEGLGRQLAEHAAAFARKAGVTELWLLTTTAAAFFEHLGWTPRARSDAPGAVRKSPEFTSLCPASASCLSRKLSD
jgi:N-acetylglutamate synthase-like GNAT family acetyltransferase